ncbi:MAG: hypothetical protein NTX52_06295 [Planctomycetota bacterium]|nr:hypothetical protein [Planctomycetota bacterium]
MAANANTQLECMSDPQDGCNVFVELTLSRRYPIAQRDKTTALKDKLILTGRKEI